MIKADDIETLHSEFEKIEKSLDPALVKYWRITISSGRGETRIRQVVLVLGEDRSEYPPVKAMLKGLHALERWARETYPDRMDWVMLPVESTIGAK